MLTVWCEDHKQSDCSHELIKLVDELAAENERLSEAVKVLRWELHQQHNLEARRWITEREVKMEDCPRCAKLASLD